MFNWAVIGTGGIAERFTSVLGSQTYGQLRGVLATSHTKATQFLQNHRRAACGGGLIYDDIDSLIRDTSIDAVYIATPHNLHFEFARQLLIAKKPVLCEKPLTVTAAETRELIDLAKKHDVFLMEALWTKTLPVWHRVRELLKNNAIGKIDHYSADMGFYFPYKPSHRLFNKAMAGGILLDLGVYPIALANWLSGMPNDIAARSVLSEQGIDLKTMVNMSFEDQVTASFTLTSRSSTENAFWIYGQNGVIRVDDLFSESQGLMYEIAGERFIESYPFQINGFEYQISGVKDCVLSGVTEHPDVSHQNTYEVMLIADQIRGMVGVDY